MAAKDSSLGRRGDCDGTRVSLPVLRSEGAAGGARIRASKNGRRRAAVLIAINVLMIVHIVQWQLMGDTLSPVEPSDSMKTLVQGAVNAGAIFFAVAILSTLIFGRFFCGWGCHIVALQDLCGWAMKKMGVRPKPFRSRVLVWAPVVFAFYMFLWPQFSRFVYEPLAERLFPAALEVTGRIVPFPEEGFQNHLVTEDFWATFPPWYVAVPFLLICGFATVYFLGAKGFCTYGCPYGGIFGPADLVAPGKIVVDRDKCHQCGHCTAVCTSNVRVHEEIRAYGMVVDPGCMKCMDCVSVCPNEALSFGFRKPTAAKGKPRGAAPKRHYDMTLAEDLALGVVMVASFLAVRGAYDAVPALFAAGLAAILTFVFFKLWRVFRDENVRLMTFQLKRAGRPTTAGVVFTALALGTLALTAHTGFVSYHKARGDRIAARLVMPIDYVLAPDRPAFSAEVLEQAEKGLGHYAIAFGIGRGGWGLVDINATLRQAARLELITGRLDRARGLLEDVLARSGPADATIADLGALKEAQGQAGEAVALLQRTLAEHPTFWITRAELATLRMAMGDPGPSIAEAEAALGRMPQGWKTRDARARTRLTLSLLYGQVGRGDDAIRMLREAVEIRPREVVMRNSLAGALAQLRGDLPGAIEQMTAATALSPRRPDLWFRRGQFEFFAGRREEAMGSFRTARTLDAANPALVEAVGQMLQQAGLQDEARRWLAGE